MAGTSKSRSGHSGATGFSYFDDSTREDVGLPPRHGDRLLRESCDHLPLFDLGRRRQVGEGGSIALAMHRPADREAAHLSMGHISSTAKPEPAADKPIPSQTAVRLWAKGSRCD